jgi:hypothetical protein
MFSISGWWKNRKNNSRKKKELKALSQLEDFLGSEKRHISYILEIVKGIKKAINNHNFKEAERLTPKLIAEMKRKKVFNRVETVDFKRFKKTMFKELKSELNAIK